MKSPLFGQDAQKGRRRPLPEPKKPLPEDMGHGPGDCLIEEEDTIYEVDLECIQKKQRNQR